LTFGNIPHKFTETKYGDNIRDRVKANGEHWLQPKLRAFFNSRLDETNEEITENEKRKFRIVCVIAKIKRFAYLIMQKDIMLKVFKKAVKKIKRALKKTRRHH
jgi:hypothetical protein